jgi:hypothetical protein
LLVKKVEKKIEVPFSFPVCFAGSGLLSPIGKKVSVSELWSLDFVDAGCCGRWLL